MKLAAIAKLIKADEYCKLYKVFYNDGQSCDLYIGTKTAIFPLTDFPKAQNERELAALLGIGEKEWNDIHFESDCPDDIRHIEGMNLDDTASGELDCENGRISIRYCGCNLLPMIEPTSRTVGFVDANRSCRWRMRCARAAISNTACGRWQTAVGITSSRMAWWYAAL